MTRRLQITVRGAVQGVGFRPFVYRLAAAEALAGWVANTSEGLVIEVEGARDRLDRFVRRLASERPPHAVVHRMDSIDRAPTGASGFEIRASEEAGPSTTWLLPDLAPCADCCRELFDPVDRRHRYPFLNCTCCGPRYTIIETLPYDRANTAMRRFAMCPACRGEYENPRDRRFHAQPAACPDCGPQLELWDGGGRSLAARDQALRAAAEALRAGRIVAVKGLGGFHLMVDGRNDAAVRRLRARKRREAKPLALLYPSIDAVTADCDLSAAEARLLAGPEAPIVLLRRKESVRFVAPSVAPGNPSLGVMLPSTPLQLLLLAELEGPLVATSGNRADEPICIDEREAVARLHDIADLWLVHDRPILRPVDDSVARVMLGRPLLLRRARGYAPLPVALGAPAPPILAVGGHLKNTVALAVGDQAVISQHLGDLGTAQACAAFERAREDVPAAYRIRPTQLACDLHPDYYATRQARAAGLPVVAVQHHHAHVAACMADNGLSGPVLGVAWDGTGYGPDGTIWGGEFLLADERAFYRIATCRRFRLPGGDHAVKEPRRAAVGLLAELWGEALWGREELAPLQSFTASERLPLRRMIARGINAPQTSSVGRLFDAIAALLELHQQTSFEGQAAMALESAIGGERTDDVYPFQMAGEGMIVLDWGPMVDALLAARAGGETIPRLAAMFHNTLCEMIVAVAERAGRERVVLTGGCFQNRYLTERAVHRLRSAGFLPYWHRQVPPNDGGLALGQLVVAAARSREGAAPPTMSREEVGHVSGHSR
jgi:hydrogenase maturation protein HypF